jgi:hypothetical protein
MYNNSKVWRNAWYYLNGINSKEQDNDFLRKPLAFHSITSYTASVGKIIELGSDFL